MSDHLNVMLRCGTQETRGHQAVFGATPQGGRRATQPDNEPLMARPEPETPLRLCRAWTDATPAGRLRSEERHDKRDRAHQQVDPQKYEGNNNDSNDYRSDSFPLFSFRNYVIERSVIDETGNDDRRSRHLNLRARPGDGIRRAAAQKSARTTRPPGPPWRISRAVPSWGAVPYLHAASVDADLVSWHHSTLVIWRPMRLPYSSRRDLTDH